MQLETHMLNELHAFRYKGENAKFALVVSHGLGGHGGIYDIFGEHMSSLGAEVWCYDAPGHGRSTTNRPRGQWTMDEWAQASRDWAAYVHKLTGLPVFTLGSSLGVAAAISAIDAPDVTGVICMGSAAVPGSPLVKMMGAAWRSDDIKAVMAQMGRGLRVDIAAFFDFDKDYGYVGAADQKKKDPYNTWSYDLSSWVSIFDYDPPEALADNKKPVLYTMGSEDSLISEAQMTAIAGTIGGPVETQVFEGAGHQLMLFETEKFCKRVFDFCTANT